MDQPATAKETTGDFMLREIVELGRTGPVPGLAGRSRLMNRNKDHSAMTICMT